jgi:hypothetical protein
MQILVRLTLCLGLGSISTGCISSFFLNKQIAGTRQASAAVDTVGDFEMVERAAAAGLSQFEGMHLLAPDNTDALFLLTKGWTGYAYGFIEDVMERSEDEGDREWADYHRARARRAYSRAIEYGIELLGLRAEGFAAAQTGHEPLKAWLAENFTDPEDAPELFWLGYAWLARGNVMKDDAEIVAQIWIGVALVERSVELDPAYNNRTGLVVLGAYHARTASAELDEAKLLFERALTETERKSLLVHFNYATKYACSRADGAMYSQLLQEILASEDETPSYRLTNAIARRKAARWLGTDRMFQMCGIELTESAPEAGGTP